MARLASAAKMGYYPTPGELVPIICKYLKRSGPGCIRIFDPCAGEGTALKVIGEDLEAVTFGVELDRERGLCAQRNLYQCLIADYGTAVISHGFASLLFLNPPYDWSARSEEIEKSERYERSFLRNTVKYLAPGGILVYLIPLRRLDMSIARMLSYRFEDIRLFRFPEPLFQQFKQIVLFGKLKKKPAPDETICHYLKDAGLGRSLAPFLTSAPEAFYEVPISLKLKPFIFRSSEIDPEELEQEMYGHGLFKDINEIARPLTLTENLTALMPLRHGHLAQLIACGFVKGVVHDQRGGRPLLVKGVTKKVVDHRVERDGDTERHIATDRFVISIQAFTATGELITIQ